MLINMIVVAGSAIINNYPLHRECMQYPINEMFQTLQGEGYFTGSPPFLFVYRDARLAVPGATQTHLGKA